MLRRPEATTKDPRTDMNTVYSFSSLFFSPSSFYDPSSFSFLPSSFFSSRLLPLLLLGEIVEEGERFHVVNGRSKGIDGDPLKASEEEAIAL